MKWPLPSAFASAICKVAGAVAIILVAGGIVGFFISIEFELSLGNHRRVGVALHPAGVRFYDIEYLQPMPGLPPMSFNMAPPQKVPDHHKPISILGPEHWGSGVHRSNPLLGHPPTGHGTNHFWMPTPFVALVALSIYLIWSLMKAHSRNICVTCGYDLRATSRTGTCPECGTQREQVE